MFFDCDFIIFGDVFDKLCVKAENLFLNCSNLCVRCRVVN
jgi:hypothetical protein